MPAASNVTDFRVITPGWQKGLNIQDAPNLLEIGELRRAENGVLDERGGFTKRLGCKGMGNVGADPDRIISAYVFNRSNSNSQLLIQTSAGNVYYTATPEIKPVAWTLISAGYSTTQPMSWETFNGKVYFCDGVSNYSSWDGTTLVTFGAAPKAKYLRLWKDTMWSSGVSGLPDRVYSSNVGDAETWGVSSYVDIRKGDGDAVRALASDGVYLIVGKRNTGTIIYDPAFFYNRVYDYEKGIESHWSVVQHESDIFYLSRRGVARWQGDQPADLISYKIDPIFDPLILNYNALDKAWAYTHEQKVCWTIPEAGSLVPTFQVNYYPRLAELTALGVRGLGPWSFDRMPVSCPVTYRRSSVMQLFSGCTTSNKILWVFADDTVSDDGNSYGAILETGPIPLGDPLVTKYLRRLRVLGRGEFYVQIKKDFQSAAYKTYPVSLTDTSDVWGGGDRWGDHVWGSVDQLDEATVNTDAYGRYFSLVFQDGIAPNAPQEFWNEGLWGGDAWAGGAPLITPNDLSVPVGSKDVTVPVGNWSVLSVLLDGYRLGVRP